MAFPYLYHLLVTSLLVCIVLFDFLQYLLTPGHQLGMRVLHSFIFILGSDGGQHFLYDRIKVPSELVDYFQARSLNEMRQRSGAQEL